MKKQPLLVLLLTILFLALGLRVVSIIALLEPREVRFVPLYSDAPEYHRIARDLIVRYTYGSATRPPVYPVFLAIVYLLSGSSIYTVVVVQIILSGLSCLLIYKLGSILFDAKVGLLASTLFAIDLTSIMYTSILMAETLFVFLLLTAIYFFVKFQKSERVSDLVYSTFVLGIAALCKPVLSYFVLFLGIVLFVHCRHNLRKAIRVFVPVLSIFAVFISTWMVRNYIFCGCATMRIDHWLIELMAAHPIQVELMKRPIKTPQEQVRLLNEAYEQIRKPYASLDGLPAKKRDIEMYKLALQIGKEKILQHPFIFLKVYLRGFWNFFKESEYPNVLRRYGWFDCDFLRAIKVHVRFLSADYGLSGYLKALFNPEVFPLVVLGALKRFFYFLQYGSLVFMICGLYVMIKREKYSSLVLLVVLVFYFPLISGPEGCVRYRLPSMPFVLLVSSYGMIEFFRKVSWMVASLVRKKI